MWESLEEIRARLMGYALKRIWPLDTECAICGRMYSCEERIKGMGADPNACSDMCLRHLPESVRTPWPWPGYIV